MHTIRIERLKSLIVDNPNDTFALFALAKEYEKVGELENAVQLFEKLLVVDEKYIGAYYHLAKVYEQLDEVKKALNIYEKGILTAQELKDTHALSELKNAKMNLEIEM
ncbi:MAG TPA: tetratricopeptide repeat protein [Chitinophagales bacterium]|jgi:tetratricopeptide (TPR) repeat protein|nr:tetratricopeptide repeat protein [Chitinophagales bacterium]HPN19077.1 tetratricopeptide repeat protein [Chitinophagales bacterium]